MHASPRRLSVRVRPRWVWAAAGTLAVTVVTVTSLRYATGACAAQLAPAPHPAAGQGPLAGGRVLHGRAFFYRAGTGRGRCSLGPLPATGAYVSVPARVYDGGASCGSYLDISGPGGTVRAEIADLCQACTQALIDMSEGAFRRIAAPAAGTAPVSYRLASNPPLAGPLAVRIGRFASATRLAVQILSHGNPLASVAVARPGGSGWLAMKLHPDDFWVAAGGAGPGPFTLRVSDVLGHQVTLRDIRLTPGSLQPTRARMYQAGGAAPGGPRAASSSPAGAGSGRAGGSTVTAADQGGAVTTGPGCLTGQGRPVRSASSLT